MIHPKEVSQIPPDLGRNVKLFNRIFHMAFIKNFSLEKMSQNLQRKFCTFSLTVIMVKVQFKITSLQYILYYVNI